MIKLIGMQPLVDMTALTLQSSFISNEPNGVSLLYVAKPETAKTSTIFKFAYLKHVAYYDEITAKKLIDEFLPNVRQQQYKTLLVPDLINCIEKQRSTREQFLALIKSGIDDTGVVRVATAYKSLSYRKLIEGIRFNMITAITTPNFKKLKRETEETGLLSRFIPFSYDYPIDKVAAIFRYIESGKATGTATIIPTLKLKPTKVEGDAELFRTFEIVSQKLGMVSGAFGIRAQINLQRLAKANAALNNRTQVEKEDIDKIMFLAKWINLDFNSM